MSSNPKMSNQELRIPQILEMQLKGHTQQEIADSLGVSRMQIYNDRHTDLYTYMVFNWLQKYEDVLNDMIENGTPQYKSEAMKEIGRMIRGTATKQIESRSTNLHLSLQEIRSTNAWVEHMTPQEYEDFKRLKDSALSRMSGVEI